MRVLFWGTPEFAAAPLRALLGEGFEVVGVVTQPDKPAGRTRAPLPPPVKQIALEEKIPVFQPEKLRDDEFTTMLGVMKPDLSVVVAYGKILPLRIVELPALGTVNIHASLLPALRGAAPIQAAIRQGLTKTGVTIMRVVQALDAGPILLQSSTPILDDETYGELQLRLSELGALTLIEALTLVSLGRISETPQDDALATYAPKVTRDDARLDWRLDATDVSRSIRAYDPKPGAFTTLRGADVKLFGARIHGEAEDAGVSLPADSGKPGTVASVEPELVVRCGLGAVTISDVQPAGKKRMAATAWARGRGVQTGDEFGT